MATREEMLAAVQMAAHTETVEDARLGGDGKIILSELDSRSVAVLELSNFEATPSGGKQLRRDGLYNARWIIATARTAEYAPLFTQADLMAVAKFPSSLAEKLVKVAHRLNGMGEEAVVDAAKN